MQDAITFFTPYPFKEGQKIRITSGPRRGDWLVTAVTDRQVTLRCPISGRQFSWNRFCYLVEEKENEPWPRTESQ